jgi:MATE family multidrug resistance protein
VVEVAIGLTNITCHSVLFGLASSLEPLCASTIPAKKTEKGGRRWKGRG